MPAFSTTSSPVRKNAPAPVTGGDASLLGNTSDQSACRIPKAKIPTSHEPILDRHDRSRGAPLGNQVGSKTGIHHPGRRPPSQRVETMWATDVGVAKPEAVRILPVPRIPTPGSWFTRLLRIFRKVPPHGRKLRNLSRSIAGNQPLAPSS